MNLALDKQNQRLEHMTQIMSKMTALTQNFENYNIEELEELNHRMDVVCSSFIQGV